MLGTGLHNTLSGLRPETNKLDTVIHIFSVMPYDMDVSILFLI